MSQNSAEVFTVNPSEPYAECPGGYAVEECEIAVFLLKGARAYIPDRHLTATNEMRRANHLHYLEAKCQRCGHTGSVVLDMIGRKTIGIELAFKPEDKNTTKASASSDNMELR